MLIKLFSRLMLLYQSISNLCNWKAVIYLSFSPKPEEKLKKIYKMNSDSQETNYTSTFSTKSKEDIFEMFKLIYAGE